MPPWERYQTQQQGPWAKYRQDVEPVPESVAVSPPAPQYATAPAPVADRRTGFQQQIRQAIPDPGIPVPIPPKGAIAQGARDVGIGALQGIPSGAVGFPGDVESLAQGYRRVTAPDGSVYDELIPGSQGGFRASRMGRALQGAADPFIGAAQLAANIPSPWSFLIPGASQENQRIAGNVNAAVRANEQAYQAARGPDAGFDWWRLGGNILSPANLAAGAATLPARGANLARQVGAGMGAGALTSGMMPVTEGEFATEKAKQVGAGAVIGGAIPLAGRAIQGILNPQMPANVQALLNEGIPVTTGRRLGPRGAAIEDKLRSFPIMGDAIAGAQRRSLDALNRAAVNRSLEPLGMALPDNIATGHDAVAYATRAIGDAYDNVLSRMSARPDQQFYNEVALIGRDLAQRVPPAQANQFRTIITGELGKFGVPGRFGANLRTLDGDALKGVQRQIRETSARMAKSQDFNTQEVGHALGDALDSFMGLAQRTNPNEAPMLRTVDQAFATFARVRDAASSSAAVDGVFSPSVLNQAVRRADRSAGKGASARGQALLQDLSNAAKGVLPQQVPNSGTADRLLLNLGALGSAAIHPGIPAALTAGGAAYTQPGQAALNALLFARPDLVRMLGEGAGRNAVALSPSAALLPTQNY